jgi:hypothetical protein
MSQKHFDLGLSEEDVRAIRAARQSRRAPDGAAALRLIADATSLVDAAVRRRPLLSGAPFKLPSHDETGGPIDA